MQLSLEYLVRKPKKAISKAPLLVLIHGYGSNEQDLFSFAEELPDDLLIISARAPHILAPGSYAWYTIHFDATDGKFSDIPEAVESREKISYFIDEICQNYDVDNEKIFLLGFSQGTVLSYSVALNYPEKVKYVIALSGYIIEELLPDNLESRDFKDLDIYISHGSVDQVLPVEWARKAPGFLENHNIKNVYSEYPVGHGVTPQNFFSFREWIKERI